MIAGRSPCPRKCSAAWMIACCRSAIRTALVSTAGRPWSSASATSRAAWSSEPTPPPSTSWQVGATTSVSRGSAARHRESSATASSTRPSAAARPSVESAPSCTTSSPVAAACAIWSIVASAAPRSPVRWIAETSRHNAAQPAFDLAVTTTRGWRASRSCPPRTGVCPRRGSGATSAGTARSTPITGAMPAARHAFANRIAPYRPSLSVRPSVSKPSWAARPTSADGWDAPYCSE